MAKRLTRNQYGSIVLPSGERITPKEQKALRNAVRQANKERAKLINALPEVAKQKHKDFGAKNEFHIRKKSAGFGHFENKAEFKRYLKATKQVASGEYEKMTIRNAYSNYIRALYSTFGSKADVAAGLISQLNEEQLKYLIDSEMLEGIDYIYHETEKDNEYRLQKIVHQLRMAKNIKVTSMSSNPVAKAHKHRGR